MTSKHDADQAGGAKVEMFTSEGSTVEPVQFPTFATTDDVDPSAPMTAEAAFEVFAGKLFAVNPYNKKKDDSTEKTTETPLQRLSRIKRELEDLQGESMLQADISTLQDQMQKLSTVQAQRQDYLTATIQASMVQPAEAVAPSSKSGSTPPQHSLESRLQHLEQQSRWLFNDRLPTLEEQLDVEALQKRAKVMRQDLEAAAKARNKLMAASGSNEDSKAIAALYDQYQQLQGVSRHLPALTERLQALAQQHVQLGSQQTRFGAVETATQQLQQQVESIESALAKFETVMEANANTMKTSVEELQKRLEKL